MIKIISRYETIQDNRDDMQLPSGRCIPNMSFDHMISSAARRRSERAGPSKIRRGNRVKVETVWSFQNRTPRLDNMMQMMLQERQIVHSPRVPYPRDPFWIWRHPQIDQCRIFPQTAKLKYSRSCMSAFWRRHAGAAAGCRCRCCCQSAVLSQWLAAACCLRALLSEWCVCVCFGAGMLMPLQCAAWGCSHSGVRFGSGGAGAAAGRCCRAGCCCKVLLEGAAVRVM